MPSLAERMSRAKPSAIMIIADKAKQLKNDGRDIISFSVGVPNFLPAEHVYDAARTALAEDSGQYLSGRGEDILVNAYLKRLEANGFSEFTKANIATGIGAKHILFSLLYALMNEGDEILIPTPFWTTYQDIADLLGLESQQLPCSAEQNYKLTAAQLEKAITPKSKVLLFNNPSNPTGMVYSQAEIKALGDVLEKHDLWIVSDDIYNRMVFDGIGFHHLLKTNPALKDRIIMIDSISKSYGMPGWRVGLMAGPESVADALVTLNSNSITNIPGVVGAAAAAAIAGPQNFADDMCREFTKKRDEVMETMAQIPEVSCPKPQGAFYAFPDISAVFGRMHHDQVIQNDVDFAERLLETKGVAVVPGRAFGTPNAIRISYACKPQELTEGLKRLRDFFSEIN
ncbi:pyridoxal phosphate-dependent aminotransferase [Aliikangiella coralliicola]|uniref:Aminotransferase n=1 Tax=Aliikangiella coralliicola TaxID=2592383 RepID=A0A545UE98_9GAMM|nr:pyridoxal phosphate-dependent aminotransferase [Aliikangiella coralliicola]TQV87804.1 pyridoxal phosphate-dependent aminotransferase [Aliikangiella coralliicola]